MEPRDPPPGYEDSVHQKEGAQRVLEAYRQGRKGFMINDEMGAGKTTTSLRAMLALYPRGRLLVLGMKVGIGMWGDEFEKYGYKRGADFIVGDSGGKVKKACADRLPIIITTHAQGRINRETLALWVKDGGVILDEAHHLRAVRPNSQVAAAVFGPSYHQKKYKGRTAIGESARFMVQLTGSPFANGKHKEAYNILRHNLANRSIWDKEWNNYFTFAAVFCGGGKNWMGHYEDDDNTNKVEFAKLLAACSIHRPLSMFRDLPPVSRKRIVVNPTNDFLERQREVMEQLGGDLGFKSHDGFVRFVRTLVEDNAPAPGMVQTLLKDMSYIKASMAFERGNEMLVNDCSSPIIMFGHHRGAIEQLYQQMVDAGWRTAFIHGDVTATKRTAIVERFQSGEVDAIVCGITATSTSINLSRAQRIILYELPWRYDDIVQAEARARRMNSVGRVRSEWLVLDKTIDWAIFNTLKAKAEKTAELAVRAGLERQKVEVKHREVKRGNPTEWDERLGMAEATRWREQVIQMLYSGTDLETIQAAAPSPTHEEMAQAICLETKGEPK